MMDPARLIEELGEAEQLPIAAIRAAQANREAMVPAFLRTLEDFLSLERPINPDALFFIFHLLGEWRVKSAYWPLAVFLRLPPDVVDRILGDSITMTSHRVMAAVFDGDPQPLYEIILDPEADEYVRAKMLHTIAMLTRRGELPRDATAIFLRDCFSQLEPRKDCFVWSGWIDAVAWLGLTELKPLAQQAFKRNSIDPEWLTFKDFEEDLQYSVEHPEAEPLHPDGDLTPFGETVADLSKWVDFKPQAQDADTSDMPHRDPLRKVGRNDPCPCGSGKKFKKCCLNAASEPLAEGVPPWESAAPSRRDR